MDFGGRKVAFKSLVGSHNYNLNTPENDRDYKVFVLPTFDDLYSNKSFSKSFIGETEDYDVHDVRKCSSLWYKANVNFLEVLFSEEFLINKDLNSKSILLITALYEMKDDIAKMNLPYLYDACIGMHYNKMKYLEKGTEGTKHLVEKYKFDTKQGLHALRILNFLEKFVDNSFTDFKRAIWYPENNDTKYFLSDIKNGELSLDIYKETATITLENIEKKYKPKYKNQEFDKKINDEVLEIIKELVKTILRKENIIEK